MESMCVSFVNGYEHQKLKLDDKLGHANIIGILKDYIGSNKGTIKSDYKNCSCLKAAVVFTVLP
jgi:hypothetical protein